jgi:ATP-dependent exoDNAse (exonuclease V) beta subunit
MIHYTILYYKKLQPKGITMKFYKNKHLYIHNNQIYTSCTTLIKKIFPVFQKYKIAQTYSKKHNIKKSTVLKQWKLKGTTAATIGTIIHTIAEDMINNKKTKPTMYYKQKYNLNLKSFQKIKQLKKQLQQIIPDLPIYPDSQISTEQILFDPKTKIAGTVDLIINNRNHIHIMDWKTSKTIQRNPFNPIEKDLLNLNIPNANYYHYSLQLALYQYLLLNTPNTNVTPHKFQHSIIHVPSQSIMTIPDHEMKQNQKYVQQILRKY